MRIVWLAFLLVFLPAAAVAVPRMPQGAEEGDRPAPRMFTDQLATALAEAGCMPRVRGHWVFDARAHKPFHWRPAPPAAVEACVAKVLPLFPSDLTGAILVWPFP